MLAYTEGEQLQCLGAGTGKAFKFIPLALRHNKQETREVFSAGVGKKKS